MQHGRVTGEAGHLMDQQFLNCSGLSQSEGTGNSGACAGNPADPCFLDYLNHFPLVRSGYCLQLINLAGVVLIVGGYSNEDCDWRFHVTEMWERADDL